MSRPDPIARPLLDARARRACLWFALGTALAACTLHTRPASAQERFAVAMFHFNVQYVAGGMVGYWATPHPQIDLDADTIEDLIITESFAPIVDLFDRHPTWGVDLEMQAYMLDAIADRHPDLLVKLRSLAKAGRIDVVSFHYSDQLFIGYPQEDWERSQKLTRDTFDRLDIPLSRSVFCQEGQASMGMAARMSQRGYRNMVWPKNLWSYQHGDFDAAPLYRFGDVFMVAGSKDVSYTNGATDIRLTWTFLDDGELLATGDIAPYMPDLFRHDPESVAKYEQRLLDLESQGYRIATVDQYVEAVKDQVPATDPPPLLDGTWQPNSTDGVSRWLGGGGLWKVQERDNHVRTLGAIVHRELVAAETIAPKAGLDARAALDGAWRLLFLGQVTDATGINPFRGEVQYGIAHFTEALRVAREVIRDAKSAASLGKVIIDPEAGSVTEGKENLFRGEPTSAPFALAVEGGERSVEQSWERVAPGHFRVAVHFGPGTQHHLGVTFPGALSDPFTVTIALDDATPVAFNRSDFAFEHFHFALPIGLIGIGQGRFVIKDQAHVHLAAKVFREKGDVEFVDETLNDEDSVTWVFHVLDGTPEEAVALANRINGNRRLSR